MGIIGYVDLVRGVIPIKTKAGYYYLDTKVTAVQFDGTKDSRKKYHVEPAGDGKFRIKTATGKQIVRAGDWLILDKLETTVLVVPIKTFSLYFRKAVNNKRIGESNE